jgi:4-hydroxy 2-oxovalerate aldolase
MTGKILLLDCTLRDGGYINDWHFGRQTIQEIIGRLTEAHIDIIELGFLTNSVYDSACSLFYDPKDIAHIASATRKKRARFALMLAIGEKEIDPVRLPPKRQTLLDMVRITFHKDKAEVLKALRYTEILQKKGYQVCLQPVGTTDYTDAQLLKLLEQINNLKPWAFYFVDTLGSMHKQDMWHMLYLLDKNLVKTINIGFHSHNNLQMSLANASEILDFQAERSFILDSSVFGMGRGAGNLCTEIIADFINKTHKGAYHIYPLLEIIDEQLMPVYAVKKWGYSTAYFLAASKNCHPDYANYLLAKQSLHVKDIDIILTKIPAPERVIYNKALIEMIYLTYQKNQIKDSSALRLLTEKLAAKEVLVIAAGQSIQPYAAKIQEYIKTHNPQVIAVNFWPFMVDWVFMANNKRWSVFPSGHNARIIFTSNIKDRPADALVVNYDNLLGDLPQEADNSGLMCLRLLHKLGIAKVTLAGFDGFAAEAAQNYYDIKFVGAVSDENIESKNQAVIKQLRKLKKELAITFLTPSIYAASL